MSSPRDCLNSTNPAPTCDGAQPGSPQSGGSEAQRHGSGQHNRGRAAHRGVVLRIGEQDPDRPARMTEGPAADLALDLGSERLSGRDRLTVHDEQLQAEAVLDVDDAQGDVGGIGPEQVRSDRIGRRPGGEPGGAHRPAASQPTPGSLGSDPAGGRDRLPATVQPATADVTAPIDDRVANFAAGPAGTSMQRPVQDEPGSDALTDVDRAERLLATASAEQQVTERLGAWLQ